MNATRTVNGTGECMARCSYDIVVDGNRSAHETVRLSHAHIVRPVALCVHGGR